MQTIGLLGGMSPESTVDYYRRINSGVHAALGGHHGARMLAYSANLDEVFAWLAAEDYDALGKHLGDAAVELERSGADFMLMACNTAHVVAPQIAARLRIPFIHIADVLGEALSSAGITRVGLLGSIVVSEVPFYQEHLLSRFGIEVLVPGRLGRTEVDRVIRRELCFHQILAESRDSLTHISRQLYGRGAEAIVLACTELGLIIEGPEVAGLPVFDTTALHADRAVALALGEIELPAAREIAA